MRRTRFPSASSRALSLRIGFCPVGPVILFLLGAALGAPPAAGSVSAYVVTSSASLFSGEYADGQIADFVLENDRIAVLIADIGHSGYYAASGGNVLDAGSNSARVDAVQDDGSGGGPAVIRVQGVDSIDASLAVVTEYSLAAGADHVVLRTTLTKTEGGSYPSFEVGDAFTWGSCSIYAPGF